MIWLSWERACTSGQYARMLATYNVLVSEYQETIMESDYGFLTYVVVGLLLLVILLLLLSAYLLFT